MSDKKKEYPEYPDEDETSSTNLIVLFLAGNSGYAFGKKSSISLITQYLGASIGGMTGCIFGNTVQGIFGGRHGIFAEKKRRNLILNFLSSITGCTHQTNWKTSIMVGIGGTVGGEVGKSVGDYLDETIGYKFPILRTVIGSGVGGIICGKFGELLFGKEKNEY